MAGIIWLASYPKSGNTWMRAFLATYIENPVSPLDINDLPNYALGDSRADCYEPFAEKPVIGLTLAELAALRPKVQDWFAKSQAGNVFVKTHNMIARVAGEPLIAPKPTAGAIYILRNPLDVCVSFAHHFQITLDEAATILCEKNNRIPRDEKTVPQYIGSWGQNVMSWMNAAGMILHVVRYEDMLLNPADTFASAVKFLDLPLEDDRLKRALDFTSFQSLKEQEKEKRFIEGHKDGRAFFREGRAGVWRERLTGEQVTRIIEANHRAMRRFGYLDEAGDPV